MACVYRHIRLDKNEPFYIGIGKLTSRAYSKKNRNLYWCNIVNHTKYEVEILFENLSWEEACFKEKEFIKIHGRCNLKTGTLCNLTDGGEGTINAIISEDRKKELSLKSKGELNIFYGKNHSEKTKKIISEKAKNRKVPDNIKLKISESLKGNNNYWYGKKLSKEHKLKLSNKAKQRKYTDIQKNKIRMNSPKRIELTRIVNGITYVYNSFREAQEMTGIERRYIKNHLNDLGFKIIKASI
jgi:hypothetical protein